MGLKNSVFRLHSSREVAYLFKDLLQNRTGALDFDKLHATLHGNDNPNKTPVFSSARLPNKKTENSKNTKNG